MVHKELGLEKERIEIIDQFLKYMEFSVNGTVQTETKATKFNIRSRNYQHLQMLMEPF